MKTTSLLTAFALTSALTLTSCTAVQPKTASSQNPEVAALQSLNAHFQRLSTVVDSLSANLSPEEQERAAFFLVSAYSLAIQAYVERGNPGNPMFTEWMDPPRKFGGDNPYTIYSQAPINTEFTYLISGKAGSAIYLGFQNYGYAQGFNIPTQGVSLDEMTLNADGSFELYVGKVRPKGARNFLQISDSDHALIVRQYFNKRVGNIPAKFAIKRADNNGSKGTTYLERLHQTDSMMTDFILGTIEVTTLLRESAFNRYPDKNAEVRKPKYGGALYPTKDNHYEGCWVDLKEGEAMRVHGYLPQNTIYASYVFYDRWYNTPTYPEVNCFRTADEIALNADGSFDLYVSPEKIDHPNWLNTGGLYAGSYSTRYLKNKTAAFPSLEIVKIKDIPSYKPAK